ncbi:MAG: hypothetical protein QM791_02940 [Ferruginibacter sp.]
MRVYQLGNALAEKFVPMDKSEQDGLKLEAIKAYTTVLDEITYIELENQKILEDNTKKANDVDFVPKPLLKMQMKHQAIKFLENWWVRYCIAALYIYLVPKIKAFINGESDTPSPEDEQASQFEQYRAFMDFQRSMR